MNKEEIYGLTKQQDHFLDAVHVLKNIVDFSKGKNPDLLNSDRDFAGEAASAFQSCLNFLETDVETIARLANVDADRIQAIFNPDHGVDAVEAAYSGIVNYSIRQYPRGDWRRTLHAELQIEKFINSLINLVDAVKANNAIMAAGADAAHSPVSPAQRDVILALANSLIVELSHNAAVVDRGRISQFGSWLARLSRRGVEKGLEGKVKEAIDGVSDAASDLTGKLGDLPGFDNLPFP